MKYRRKVLGFLLVFLLTLSPLVTLFANNSVDAAIVTAFDDRFSTNDTGDIVFVGNTLMTCPDTDSDCADARASNGNSDQRNNDFNNMVFVDVDSDASTWNSSRADFTLPSGGEVLWAGLYWGAREVSADRTEVLFDTPATAGYQTIEGA